MLPYEVIWPTVIVLGGPKNIMAVMSKRLYYNKIHRVTVSSITFFYFLALSHLPLTIFTKAASKREGFSERRIRTKSF